MAKTKKDRAEDLGFIGDLVLDQFKALLAREEPLTAGELGVVTKFLKEQGFTIDPIKEGDALDSILEGMQKKKTPTFPDIPLAN